MGFVPMMTPEAWWYLAMGRLIQVHEAIPAANHIAYTLPIEAPSFLLEWMAARAMLWMQQWGGVEALVSARNLALAASIALLTALVQRDARHAGLSAAAGLLGALIAGIGLTTSPVMFAALLFATALGLGHASVSARGRALSVVAWVCLPLLAALWANIEASCLLMVPAALWFGAKRARAVRDSEPGARWHQGGWLVSAALCALAPLLNPRGAAIYGHIVEVFATRPQPDAISALWMQAPLFSVPRAAMLGGLMVIMAMYGYRKTRPHPEDLLAALGLAALSLLYQTGLVWLGLALPLILARGIAARGPWHPPGPARSLWLRAGLGASALLCALLMLPLLLSHAPIASQLNLFNARTAMPHRAVIQADVPLEVAGFLTQAGTPPRVFADRKHEPYLIFRLLERHTARVMFSDPRTEMYPPDVLALRQSILGDVSLWRGLFQGWGVSAVVLQKTARNQALITQMREHPEWLPAHEDEELVYLVKVAR